MLNSENEFKTSITTRSFSRAVLAMGLILFGLCAIYDIEPIMNTSNTISAGFNKMLETGPYTGDFGINAIGSLFVLAGLLTIYKIFDHTVYSLHANPEYISIHKNGDTTFKINKKDIDSIYKSGMTWYGLKVIVKAGDDEFVFSGFEKILLYSAWDHLIANNYPVE